MRVARQLSDSLFLCVACTIPVLRVGCLFARDVAAKPVRQYVFFSKPRSAAKDAVALRLHHSEGSYGYEGIGPSLQRRGNPTPFRGAGEGDAQHPARAQVKEGVRRRAGKEAGAKAQSEALRMTGFEALRAIVRWCRRVLF